MQGKYLGQEVSTMGMVALLLLIALVFGGFGLFAEGLRWFLIIAIAFAVAGMFGFRGTRRS